MSGREGAVRYEARPRPSSPSGARAWSAARAACRRHAGLQTGVTDHPEKVHAAITSARGADDRAIITARGSTPGAAAGAPLSEREGRGVSGFAPSHRGGGRGRRGGRGGFCWRRRLPRPDPDQAQAVSNRGAVRPAARDFQERLKSSPASARFRARAIGARFRRRGRLDARRGRAAGAATRWDGAGPAGVPDYSTLAKLAQLKPIVGARSERVNWRLTDRSARTAMNAYRRVVRGHALVDGAAVAGRTPSRSRQRAHEALRALGEARPLLCSWKLFTPQRSARVVENDGRPARRALPGCSGTGAWIGDVGGIITPSGSRRGRARQEETPGVHGAVRRP